MLSIERMIYWDIFLDFTLANRLDLCTFSTSCLRWVWKGVSPLNPKKMNKQPRAVCHVVIMSWTAYVSRGVAETEAVSISFLDAEFRTLSFYKLHCLRVTKTHEIVPHHGNVEIAATSLWTHVCSFCKFSTQLRTVDTTML